MSSLLFPTYCLTEENQDLLGAIVDEFGHWDDESEDFTIESVLEDVEHYYIYDNKVIELITDGHYCFDEISTELFHQGIPFDIIHHSDYDSNSAVEFYRNYMERPKFINTDSFNNPVVTINTIRSIIDAQDEDLTDIEVMNKLIAEINDSDFLREGNRIQDVA